MDNLSIHHNKPVKKSLEKKDNKNKIEVFYLPSYSPDRNPDEYLNYDLKQGLSAKPSPKTQDKLTNNIKNHMEMLQHSPQRITKYFKHKSIKYAA